MLEWLKYPRDTDATKTSYTLDFSYDASGSPMAVTYNGTTYYYALNLQGDVVAILNGSGSTVVSYAYDAWGNVQNITGTMASTLGQYNPLRYRGYVFDTETESYYLQSRYYNPETCRFLNADAFASTGQGLLGNNMFAYCLNNPVMGYDPTGEIAITTLILIGSAIVGAVCAGYTAYTTYQAGWDTEDILWYTFGSGLGGFLSVYTLGMSTYQVYLNYCMLNGITPVAEISFSNNTVAVYGASPAPEQGIPNSTYNKVDQDGTTITSTTYYNDNCLPEYRADYYIGTNPHTHFDKVTQTLFYDHIHYFYYNDRNQVCGKPVFELQLD